MIRHHLRTSPPGTSPGDVLAAYEAIQQQFARLYALTETSPHLFGSPLGPFRLREARYDLARCVYFGPNAGEDTVRLAFQAGFDGTDLRSVRALTYFAARLALWPDIGQGLHLSFFPLANPSGLELGRRRNASGVDLVAENWARSEQPEIALLRQDALTRSYHGFVRIEAAPIAHLTAVVRQSGRDRMSGLPALIAEEQSDVFPIQWEQDVTPPLAGPLTIADDLALQPFELVLRVPRKWSDDIARDAVVQVLRRVLVRYRAALAYGINL